MESLWPSQILQALFVQLKIKTTCISMALSGESRLKAGKRLRFGKEKEIKTTHLATLMHNSNTEHMELAANPGCWS